MGFTVCPAAVIAAPVESVWELLSEPALRDEWWDARTRRVVPEGKASPGQVIYKAIEAGVEDSLQRLKRRAEAGYRSRAAGQS